MRFCYRVIFIVVCYVLGLITLMTYSLVGYFRTDTSYQALVNSIAIITTDVISLLVIFITKQTGFNPIINSSVAILMRVFIVAFSGPYWFGGYCIIYLILMLSVQVLIINKYYPTYEKIPTAKVMKTNIFKMP